MKRLFLFACIAIFLPGCQKIMEYYNINQPASVSHCRLISETDPADPVYQRTLFEYNDDGTPRSISVPYPDEGHFLGFTYDGQGRLLEEIASTYVGPGSRKYVYEGDSRLPVRDTLYRWYGLIYTESFTYDANDRIIREDVRLAYAPDDYDEEVFGDARQWEYSEYYYYDLRGNRQYPPQHSHGLKKPIEYSDKPDPYLLHPVFQLYYRNFSRNSTKYADRRTTSFNEALLPLAFSDSPMVLAYDCE